MMKNKTLLILSLVVISAILIAGCTQQTAQPAGTTTPAATQAAVGMANPASVACGQAGGMLEIKKDNSGNEYGMCTFKNGTSCEEWALFRGEGCKPGLTNGNDFRWYSERNNFSTGNRIGNKRFSLIRGPFLQLG